MATTTDLSAAVQRRPGAHVHAAGVSYRVWAPHHPDISVRLRRSGGGAELTLELAPQGDGYFGTEDADGRAGDRYGFAIGGGPVLPDPASRFQPEGVHGWSECIDPGTYRWRAGWTRPGWRGQSIYEVHVGTFTPEGTFRSAIGKLDHLVTLGVDAIEIMPVADFPGARNWGYDGVSLYAPARCYGTPDDLRALVDAAHERGLTVILDVVYNHLGPDGNYLSHYSMDYFHPDRHTPWGSAFNLTGANSGPVREFFRANAAAWLDEYRIDGLRLDATHAIIDDSDHPLLGEIAALARERGAFTIAEDERNTCAILRRPDGTGARLDAAWADDFHHQLRVALTGVQDSYFRAYTGSTEDIVRTLQSGWFFTGQKYAPWRGEPRGEACDHLPARSFVHCLENHDQVGNRARGERLEHLISPAAFRAASALLCLSPYPPMLFMGQEWAAASPFLYFTDHLGELGRLVSEGRRKEFSGLHAGIAAEQVPDPQEEATFLQSKLQWDELRLYPHASVLTLYRICLQHRATWLRGEATDRTRWKVAAIDGVVALRYTGGSVDRLLLCTLNGETRLAFSRSDLLRPPEGTSWEVILDSNAAGAGSEAASTPVVWTGSEHRVIDTLVFDSPGTVLLASSGLPAQ